MNLEMWNIERETGYKPMTTFWQDFTIAEKFGVDSIKDTYKRAFKEWKNDYKYLTELSLVLNHKCWRHYNTNRRLAQLYGRYFEDVNDYAMTHLKDKQLEYYFKVID